MRWHMLIVQWTAFNTTASYQSFDFIKKRSLLAFLSHHAIANIDPRKSGQFLRNVGIGTSYWNVTLLAQYMKAEAWLFPRFTQKFAKIVKVSVAMRTMNVCNTHVTVESWSQAVSVGRFDVNLTLAERSCLKQCTVRSTQRIAAFRMREWSH